jgi:hypothetical protein
MNKLSLAALRGGGGASDSCRSCCNRRNDSNWNGNGGGSLQSSKSLGLVSSHRGDDGDKGNKEEGKLEHLDLLFVFGTFKNCER